ncbi:hypothetical protein NC651_020605 [Populus alba x Populus x berolinensis]|nr:hypothetical protein NC651_020605 [Populus alba x Populus x berolinensis]
MALKDRNNILRTMYTVLATWVVVCNEEFAQMLIRGLRKFASTFKVNVADKCPDTLRSSFGSSSVEGWSHIPLPCVAASLPLQVGTGHETYIPVSFQFLSRVYSITVCFLGLQLSVA